MRKYRRIEKWKKMANNKVWKIVDRDEEYSDLELKEMIANGTISLKEKVYTKEIVEPIELDKTVYRFFKKEDQDETI